MVVRLRLARPTDRLHWLVLALQALFVVIGVCSFCAFGWLQFERHYVGARYLEQFDRAPAGPLKASGPDRAGGVSPPDGAPGSLRAGASAPASPSPSRDPALLARLRIPRLDLDAPVLDGADDTALRRGAGWIHGTARPGDTGNVGIAGHRDTFFRPLREIRSGDRIELQTPDARRSYVVRSVYVVEPESAGPLRPTTEPMLTLVTCFPFYFVGPAPRRYIVQAELAGD